MGSESLAPAFDSPNPAREAHRTMAKIIANKDGVAPDTEGATSGEREKLWKEYIERYRVSNPVKYKLKEASFAVIPPSFKGIVREVKTSKGVIREIH